MSLLRVWKHCNPPQRCTYSTSHPCPCPCPTSIHTNRHPLLTPSRCFQREDTSDQHLSIATLPVYSRMRNCPKALCCFSLVQSSLLFPHSLARVLSELQPHAFWAVGHRQALHMAAVVSQEGKEMCVWQQSIITAISLDFP